MKYKLQLGVLLVSLIFILAACQAANQPTNSSQVASTPIPSPAADKASIVGKLVNMDGEPLASVTVRLAEIFRQGEEGAFVLDVTHSPGNITNVDGSFYILDFTPNEYLLVIGEPDNNNYVIYQKAKNEPQTYQTESGQILDVGTISVDFTP